VTGNDIDSAVRYGICRYCHTPLRQYVVQHRGVVNVGIHCPLCRPNPVHDTDDTP
jgi:hypothetical protein